MAITTSSDEARELFLKGREEYDNIEFADAMNLFDQAIALDPDFALAHNYRALTSGSFKEAIVFLDKAVVLTDRVSEGEAEFILYNAAFDDGTKQKKHLDRLEQLLPRDRYVLTELGSYHYGALRDYKKALIFYNKVTEIVPDYGPTYNMIGYCHIILKNYDKAEVALKKYIELSPDSPNPYDSYAELLLTTGKYDQSIENYQKAYDKDNSFTTALLGIGTNYVMKGEFDKARDTFKKAYGEANRNNDKFAALNSIVYSYVEEDNIDTAVKTCEDIFEFAKKQNLPENMFFSLDLACTILCENDRLDEAMVCQERMVKVVESPELDETIRNIFQLPLGWHKCRILGAENKLDEAGAEATKCFKMAEDRSNPGDLRTAHRELASLLIRKGEYQSALDNLQKANQDNAYNWYLMALANEGLDRNDKAGEMYQKIVNENNLNFDLALVRQKAKAKL